MATDNPGYAAAHNGAVLVDRSALGVLKFSGKTRLDLINRMSTQAVAALGPGQGAATVLTTEIGRIIDRLILYAGSKAVYCLTGENNGDAIARYLMGFVFFMDDFQVEDLSAETAVLAVYGAQAAGCLSDLLAQPAIADLPRHHWLQLELAGRPVYIHRTDPVAGDGYFVMCQLADQAPLWQALVAGGITPIDEATFDYLRIESGLPRFGRELTGDYIPLETGLWDDVSFTKGCYTGQEIIARMESRGRIAKKLTVLYPAEPIEAGQKLTAAGKKVGSITSAADGTQGPLALGYLKTAVLEQKGELLSSETPVYLERRP